MAQFLLAYHPTLCNEGRKLTNIPGDAGGETYVGISRSKNPAWPGWAYIDARRGLPGFPGILYSDPALELLLLKFYKAEYWDCFGGDQVPDQHIANRLFDASVNLGGIEFEFLQEGLNLLSADGDRVLYPEVKEDGHVGPQTLQALAVIQGHGDNGHLMYILEVLQGQRYLNICRRDPLQRNFLRGWLNRDFKES